MGSGITQRLIWVFIGLWGSVAGAQECQPDLAILRGDWGTAEFTVEVADTEEERAQGLMNRTELGQSSGMLFVYEAAKPVAFWMKNTLIPLDMIFFDAHGVVTYVHSHAIPGDERPIFGGQEVKAVLEINADLAEKMGISAGTELRHPSFDQQKAKWGC